MSVEAVISTQVIDTTSVGRSLMTAADAAAARTALSLGTLSTQNGTFSGTSSGTNTGDQSSVSGNAGSATVLQTARNINGVAFDGSASITVTAAGSTLSDTVTVAKGGTGLTALGSALQTIRVNASGTALEYATASGLSGTGSVDNAVLRADGTGGETLQSSAFVIADNATASPNNTVNHASLQATGGTTNVSVSIVPKAAGAFCLSAPDGTTTGGNARGDNAIDLQTSRGAASQVASGSASVVAGTNNTASGIQATAVGRGNTAGNTGSSAVGWGNAANASVGTRASCFGYQNTANVPRGVALGHGNTSSGNYGSAVGYSNTASGAYSSAIGRGNTSGSNYASAFGNLCVASAAKASAFGYRARSTVANTLEVGYWSNATTRGGSLRIHGTTGMSSLTIQDRSTAYTDGGSTLGSEADNTIGRGMFAVRRNGDALLIDVNIAGTVKTLSLGTAT